MNRSRDGARYASLVESVPRAAATIDGAWFAANPDRTARVRSATADEVELACLRFRWPKAPGAGLRYAVATAIDEPLGVVRTFAVADLDGLAALNDDMLRCLFSALGGRQGDPRRVPGVSVEGSRWVLR